MSYVYVFKCNDRSYYTGYTKDFKNRIKEHKQGNVKYTKSRLPVKLVFLKEFKKHNNALLFEKKVKSWKKRKSIEKMVDKADNIVNKE